MSTFPFLSVPVLARNLIVKNLCLEDLIILSTCSKRAYNSVKAANITLNRIQLKLANLPSILIEYPFDVYEYLGFAIWGPGFDREDLFYIIYLNGVRVWWKSGILMPFYSESVGGKEEALELLYDYFRDLFKVNKLDVSLRPGIVKDFFLWKTTKSINKLEIDSLNTYDRPSPTILYPSEEEIKFAVEELNAKVLKISPDQTRFYENGLKQEEVQIEKANWLHINALLNSESSRISLSNPWLSGSNLNLFVKNWVAGIGLENFKHLFITYENGWFTEGFQEKILRGIETVKWDPINRPENFEDNKLGAGRDFRRADGTWATVLVDGRNFIFHVWK